MGGLFGGRSSSPAPVPTSTPPAEQATFEAGSKDEDALKRELAKKGKSGLTIAKVTGGVSTPTTTSKSSGLSV